MPEPVVHILEPTARSVYGHHFGYCERGAEYLALAGYETFNYFAWEGGDDQELRTRAVRAKFAFTFRYGRAFERSYGGEITDDDPIERRGLRRAKEALRDTIKVNSIDAENLLWRMRFDMDAVAGRYALSGAETQTVEEASADIALFAQLLRTNHAQNSNILFLPTGEFFLLHGLLRQLEALSGRVAQIHIRMWNFLSLEKHGADLVGLALELQRAAASYGIAVYLYAETDWACDRLAGSSTTPVGYLDINSFSEISIDTAVRQAEQRAQQPRPERFRVFFPGSFRRFPDKGLAFLHELLTWQPFPETLHVVIQEPDFEALRVDAAQVRANPNVTVRPRIIDDGAYRQEFEEADAICVPYDHVTWPDLYRGSGVILEAILAAKPVVVTANTPLARYSGVYDLNVLGNCREFVALMAGFDHRAQFLRAVKNCRTYAGKLHDNPLLVHLPAPAREPVLRERS